MKYFGATEMPWLSNHIIQMFKKMVKTSAKVTSNCFNYFFKFFPIEFIINEAKMITPTKITNQILQNISCRTIPVPKSSAIISHFKIWILYWSQYASVRLSWFLTVSVSSLQNTVITAKSANLSFLQNKNEVESHVATEIELARDQKIVHEKLFFMGKMFSAFFCLVWGDV